MPNHFDRGPGGPGGFDGPRGPEFGGPRSPIAHLTVIEEADLVLGVFC